MTALASSDVTVTVTQRKKVNGSPTRRNNNCTIAFGDGALTYSTGGVPMPTGGSFGMNGAVVDSMIVQESAGGAGYIAEYDPTNNKMYLWMGDYNNAADGPLIQVANATAIAAMSLECTVIGY